MAKSALIREALSDLFRKTAETFLCLTYSDFSPYYATRLSFMRDSLIKKNREYAFAILCTGFKFDLELKTDWKIF